ncbi:hypothetical protein DFH06DRAFT_293761 [Mycena polygramma]|nr:hypothetical protein DFH06DRAFT_293761 [Mycena polygramma]
MPVEGVQELRARIDALSSQIAVQRDLLKSLEHDKSLVQRKLNAALDPIARLPLEIWSEIFLRSLPSIPERPGADAVPMLLLNVCHAWTDIALLTPDLWTVIRIACPCPEGFEEGLRTWLQRAGNRPLAASLRGNFHDGDVPALIWEYGEQLQRLVLSKEQGVDEDHEDTGDTNDDPELIDLFRDTPTPPGPLPLLEALTIRGSGFTQQVFSGRQILDLLRLACNLIECTFQDMYPVSDDMESTIIVHPSLCHLAFGECSKRPNSDDTVLNFLTLPALQTLRVSLDNLFDIDLLSFLERSSPPLKDLVIGNGRRSGTFENLCECLGLVPSLERFEVWGLGSSLLHQLCTALTSPSLVPDLRTLRIIHLYESNDQVDSCWETLLRVLSSRSKLRIVHVEMLTASHLFRRSFEPTSSILAAFRELVKDGMQIYIGADTNLVTD